MRKLLLILFLLLLLACLFTVLIYIPSKAEQIYGQPAAWLTVPQRVQYSAPCCGMTACSLVHWISMERNSHFKIEQGESVNSIVSHLEVVT